MPTNSPVLLGNRLPQNIPQPQLVDNSSWSQVSTKSSYTFGIKSNNTLYAWGVNNVYQVGDGTTINKSSPIQISSSSFSLISAGFDHSVAIDTNNKLYTWGNRPSINTLTTTESWSVISESGNHALAIRNDGLLFAWGLNNAGQLGDATTINKSSPVQLGSGIWSDVSTGPSHSLAISSTGQLYMWGHNNAGQVGDNTTINKSSPVQIGTSSWTHISAGSSYSTAIDSTNRMFAWGVNNLYQLGDLSTISKSSPAQIGSTNSWNAVSSGFDHSTAIDSVGNLYVWGNFNAAFVPMPTTIYSWTQIEAGASHSTGLRSDGTVWVWGGNVFGQLGQNYTQSRSSPVQVTSSSFTQVSGKYLHTAAIGIDGKLYVWGYGDQGQLGTGTASSRSSPVQIGTDSWSIISTGNYNTAAITSDGKLFSWGFGTNGQIGDSSIIGKSSPVQIGVTSNFTDTSLFNLPTRIVGPTQWAQVSPFATWPYDINTYGLSGSFNGSSTSILVSDNPEMWYGIGDFTIETFIYKTSSGLQYIWLQQNTNGGSTVVALYVNASNKVVAGLRGTASGQGSSTDVTGTTTINLNQWYHIAWVRQSGTVRLYVDGKLDGTLGDQTQSIRETGGGTPTIGSAIGVGAASYFNGYISNLRIVRGIAVYSGTSTGSANFTVPTTILTRTQSSSANISAIKINQTCLLALTVPEVYNASFTQISSGDQFSLALDTNSNLYAFGLGTSGQTGTRLIENRPTITKIGTESWNQISAGPNHSLAIRNDNTLWTWGSGTAIGLVTEPMSWLSVNAGATHTLGIRDNGTLWAWGTGTVGQLGDFTAVSKLSPVQIGLTSWSLVCAANSFSFATDINKLLYGWGLNSSGQLGDSTIVSKSSPVQIGTNSWNIVAGGVDHALAIDTTGKLYGWGNNTQGQLGLTNVNLAGDTINRSSPVQIGSTSWNTVATGSSYSVGITTDNLLYGWGTNTAGQLADRTTIAKSSPVQLSEYSWNTVSAGVDHVLAIRSDTTLWTWGNSNAISLLVQPQSWSTISSGASHTLAIRSDGALFAWGIGTSGQLGDSTIISKSSPTVVGTSSWSQVSAGTNFSLATDINGRLFAWGLNTSNQLGDASIVSKSSPVQISGSYTSVTAGDTHAFGVITTGALYGWGTNTIGQILPLGNDINNAYSAYAIGRFVNAGIRTSDKALFVWGDNTTGSLGNGTTISRSSPIQLGTNSWKLVAGGGSTGGTNGGTFLAIRDDDTLWTWGANNAGQLGDNSTINKSSPVQVAGSWSFIASGFQFSGGIKIDGTLWMWGTNPNGELGDGTLIGKSSPVQVSGGGSWTFVSTGTSFGLAISSTNKVYAWGRNAAGQLGDGTTINKSIPTLLAAPFNTTSFVQVAAGLSHSLGITSTGLLYGWGGGSVGELGLGSLGTVNRSNPTQITVVSGSPATVTSWTSIAAGSQLSTGINNSNLYVWGINNSGQLGVGDTLNRSFPTQIGLGYSWQSAEADIASGGQAGFLRSDNTLWLTGSNTSGNLGNNSTVNRSAPIILGRTTLSTPVQVGTSSWSLVSAGNSFTTGIDSLGKLYAWGLNNLNQLGNTSNVNRDDAIIQPAAGSWTKVSSGANHTLAINSSGILYAWGNPSAVLLSNVVPNSWSQIASDGVASHLAAIRSDGTLWTWGLNTNGQIGDGTTINKSSPTQIGTNSWTSVAVSLSNTMAIQLGGNLYVWGGNAGGQLGDNTTLNRSSPIQIDSNSWSQISVDISHVSAIRSNLLFVWGNNANGQLGDGSTISKSSPVQVAGSWNSVGVGSQYTLAINDSNLLFSWGNNAAFQLGDNTTLNKSSPIQIAAGISFTSVSAGPTHAVAIDSNYKLWTWGQQTSVGIDVNSWTQVTYTATTSFGMAIRSDGRLFGWGLNTSGQLGLGDTIFRSSPVLVGANSWTYVSAGGAYSLGIASNGALFAWGINSSGELGIGLTTSRSSPVVVASGTSFTLVSAGPTHALAVDTLAKLFAWGQNNIGQLGDGTTINRSSPLQIGTSSWTQISSGVSWSSGIDTLGKLYTWGLNSTGQLGNSTTINRSSPLQIGTSSWTKVSAGTAHALGITIDSGLFAWGQNNAGQLGNSTTINRSAPVQLGTSSWSVVSAGASVSVALTSNNTLFTWGLNSSGQIGDGTTINKSSPVQVLGGAQWSYIATGFNNTFAISSANATKNKLFVWGSNAGVTLGLGDTINRSSPTLLFSTTGTVIPTKILNYQSFSQVSAGTSYSLAKRANDNVVMGWGVNTVGNLGDNTLTQSSRSNPVIVGQPNQVDNSNNNLVPTAIGGAPKVVDFSPFANSPYNTVTTGGSMQFNGVTDGIAYATNSVFNIGSNDACIEVWLYFADLRSCTVYGQNSGALSTIRVGINTTQSLIYTVNNDTLRGATAIVADTWYHVMVTITGGNARFFVNGVLRDYATGLGGVGIRSEQYVFGNESGVQFFNGYMSNFRMCNGSIPTDYQTSSTTIGATIFTPSTSPLTTGSQGATEANVSLLCFQGFATAYTGSIAAIGQTSAFSNSTGELYLTGLGTTGQQGDGTIISESKPVQLGTGFVGLNTGFNVPLQVTDGTWNDVRAGNSFSVAQKQDLSVYTWGLNSSGVLATGSVINRSSPVQIAGFNQTFVDDSTSALTISRIGTVNMILYSPFATYPYDVGVYGGSAYLDGASYLNIPNNNVFQIGSGFTVECWIYFMGVTGDFAGIAGYNNITFATAGTGGWIFSVNSARSLSFNTYFGDQANTTGDANGTILIGLNIWTHVAVTINNGTIKFYVNGAQDGTRTLGAISYDGASLSIGRWNFSTQRFFKGYISNLRITNTVVYDSNFTVPSMPLTNVTGTQLLTVGRYAGTVTTVDLISAGGSHAFYKIATDSTLYGWGLGTSGQLGIGDTIARSNPIQLGNGGIINTYTNSPVQVTPGTSGYSQVFAGQSFSVARKTDDSLFAWGLNTSGQLGLNSLISRSSPTQVGIPFSVLDISTNSFTITRVGTTYSTSVIPLSGAVSGLFGPTTQYLNLAAPSVLSFGTNDFTIEFFVNPTSAPAGGSIVIDFRPANTSGAYPQVGFTDTAFAYYVNASTQIFGGPTPTIGTWYHVALVRIGSNTKLYVNGTQAGSTYTDTNVYLVGASRPVIGTNGYTIGVSQLNGYVSNLRIVNGVGVYTGTFTPPNSILSISQSAGTNINAVASNQTALLTYTTFAQTINEPNVTFTDISAGYSHVEFIATDDRLYATGLGTSGQMGFGDAITRSLPTIVGNGQVINTGTLSPIQVSFGLTNSWAQVSAGQSFSLVKDIAGTVYVWGLGSSGQLDNGSTINRSSPQIVGSTLISVLDVSGQNNTISRVGTNFSTTIIPTAGAVSGYFNGVTDYLRCDSALDIFTGAGDFFTIEGFVYPINSPGNTYFLGLNGITAGENSLLLGPQNYLRNNGATQALSTFFPDNTWTHFAITYDGTTFRIFNGGNVMLSSGTQPNIALTDNVLLFGTEADGADGTGLSNYFNGYLSSIRITKQALYTGTFTPPTDILTNSSVGTSGANVAASLTGTVSLLTYTTVAATIVGGNPSYFDNISAGLTHAVTTYSDKTLYAWGLNSSGQLGDNTAISKSSPVLIGSQFNTNTTSPVLAASASWIITSAGTSHSMAVKNDGALWTWGLNGNGQLGDGTTINKSSIVQVSIGTSYSSVNAGTSISLAITNTGLLFAWGAGTSGQLGANTALSRSAPLQVGTSSWSQVSTGLLTALGIDNTGKLYGWGSTATGQLGQSVVSPTRSNPTLVQGINYETKSPTLVNGTWSTASAGLSHTLGISSGSLYVWGLNSSGQLGDGTVVNKSSPTQIGAGSFTVLDVSSYSSSITKLDTSYTTDIVPIVGAVSGVFAGNITNKLSTASSTIFLLDTSDFSIECWFNTSSRAASSFPILISNGNYSTGKWQLNDRHNSYPTKLTFGVRSIQIDVGFLVSTTTILDNTWYHVAIVRSGSNWTMYVNGVAESTNTSAAAVGDVGAQTVYVGSDATGQAGTYYNGKISNIRIVKGVAVYTGNFTVPTSVLTVTQSTGTNISAITAGQTSLLTYTTAADSIQTTGVIYNKITAGSATTFGITSDGNLYAWGLGNIGQTSGYLTTINRSSPTQIGNNFLSINQSRPAQVAAGSWTSVAVGTSLNTAIRSDGKLFTWGGLNTSGQLGDGTTVAKSSPVQIGNSSWTQVSTEDTHVIARTIENYAYAWGNNATGQLGDNTTINKSSPVLVGSLFNGVLDASANALTLTKFGTTFSNTIVPIIGSVAGQFSATGDRIQVGPNSVLAVGITGTVEFWMYANTFSNFGRLYAPSSNANAIHIGVYSTGQLYYMRPNNTEAYTTATLQTSTWYHVAFVINFGTLSVYINGVSTEMTYLGSPTTVTGIDISGTTVTYAIGSSVGGGSAFDGYISNFRVVKGVAVYTGNFTVPTSILTTTQSADTNINAITGTQTSLLTYTTQAATIVGGSPTYFNSVGAGSSFTLGTYQSGALYVWGFNSSGQLGLGTTINRSSPVQIGSSSYTYVDAGSTTASAIRSDGALFAFGLGTSGQLAEVYLAISRSDPSQVGNTYPKGTVFNPTRVGYESWSHISAGNSYSLAIEQNNTLFAWGLNSSGQLGINSTINRSSPAQVGSATYLNITAGQTHTTAIAKDS